METIQMYSNIDDFGNWLSHELREQKITVSKLAKISGVHPNTIRNYLAHRCEPTLYNTTLIIEALGYCLRVVKR